MEAYVILFFIILMWISTMLDTHVFVTSLYHFNKLIEAFARKPRHPDRSYLT